MNLKVTAILLCGEVSRSRKDAGDSACFVVKNTIIRRQKVLPNFHKLSNNLYSVLFIFSVSIIHNSFITLFNISFNITQFYVLPTQLYLCVLCGSENKQLLFPYTALTEWVL